MITWLRPIITVCNSTPSRGISQVWKWQKITWFYWNCRCRTYNLPESSPTFAEGPISKHYDTAHSRTNQSSFVPLCLTPPSNESNMAKIHLHLLCLWISSLAAQFSSGYPPCAVIICRFLSIFFQHAFSLLFSICLFNGSFMDSIIRLTAALLCID